MRFPTPEEARMLRDAHGDAVDEEPWDDDSIERAPELVKLGWLHQREEPSDDPDDDEPIRVWTTTLDGELALRIAPQLR
jgi:hypothetical protein